MRPVPDRDAPLDGAAEPAEIVGKPVGTQVGAHRRHAAADVDTDRGGGDGLVHGDHGSDGGSLPVVDVGHDAQPVGPRKGGDVAELPDRGFLDAGLVGHMRVFTVPLSGTG